MRKLRALGGFVYLSGLCLSFSVLILINKPAYSEQAKGFRPRLSVRLSGAFGLTAIGDINKVLGSVNNNETFRYWRKNDPKYIVGEIKKLNVWTPDWEAEVRIDLTRRIGVGIATSGGFKRNGDSSLTYTYPGSAGPQVHTFRYKTEIEAGRPVRLSFYYTLNPGAPRTIFFYAGVGHYSGRMSIFRNLVILFPRGGSYTEKIDCRDIGRRSSFGFHAGAGIEYPLTKKLGFILELRASFVRIGGFTGVMDWENSYGEKYTIDGDLYYFSMFDDSIVARYSGLEVWEKPPDFDFRDPDDIRKARVDLSGISLRAGIRLALF